MESALRPRDIQARIRAGASPEEVAEAAGVTVERIAAFADPVIAERDYIAGLARTNPVRRRGETTSHRTLRNAVTDALAARGIDADGARWDSWKLEDRRWQVQIRFDQEGTEHNGLFVFDAMGRFSVAANDEGRALIGDGRTDQLALVHATQDPLSEEETTDALTDDARAETDPAVDGDPAEEDFDDAFHDGGLQEVDGVFDIVPAAKGDLDILYDMLSSFDEDSVKIYAGLVHPKESTPLEESPVVELPQGRPDAEPITPPARPAEDDDRPEEPEQLALIDEPAEPAPKPKPRGRRKRASVPTWDEIMFGTGRPDED